MISCNLAKAAHTYTYTYTYTYTHIHIHIHIHIHAHSPIQGYFLDNELSCPPTPNVALHTFLALPAHSPGYLIAREYKRQHHAQADAVVASGFARLVAARYFQVTSAAVRHFDASHLVLGCKFMNVDGLAPLLAAAAPHVDAHALDVYAFTPGEHYMRGLFENGGRLPFIIAEFSFQSKQSFVKAKHVRGAGPVLDSQRQRAVAVSAFIDKVMQMEFVVGYHFFQYMDQPDTSSSNYGIVSVNDTVYDALLSALNRTNRQARQIHARGRRACPWDDGPTRTAGKFYGWHGRMRICGLPST